MDVSVQTLTQPAVPDLPVLPGYQVLERLGSGGMAIVYRGIQSALDRPVAIKRLHTHLTPDPTFLERFAREAKAAASLHHEHIVSVIDFAQKPNGCYIVMEYVEGATLRALLRETTPLPLEIVLLILASVARGLAFAHDRGFVHRDIKPDNIMVGRDGSVKITDFGIVKSNADTTLTRTGSVVGSPAYMAPELLQDLSVDSRADIFSFGVTAYEILAGAKPFRGDSPSAVITSMLHHAPVPLLERNQEVSPALEDLIGRCMRKNPADRPQDLHQLAGELYEFIAVFDLKDKTRILRDFMAAPIQNAVKLQGERKERHLQAAKYYLSQGLEKTMEARGELGVVLALDPAHAEAGVLLEQLNTDPKLLEALTPLPQPAHPRRQLLYPGGVVLLFVAVLLLWYYVKEKSQPQASKPSGYLVIDVLPSADIYVDGKYCGSTPPPLLLNLDPGSHRVHFAGENLNLKERSVTLAEGETVLLKERLKPAGNGAGE